MWRVVVCGGLFWLCAASRFGCSCFVFACWRGGGLFGGLGCARGGGVACAFVLGGWVFCVICVARCWGSRPPSVVCACGGGCGCVGLGGVLGGCGGPFLFVGACWAGGVVLLVAACRGCSGAGCFLPGLPGGVAGCGGAAWGWGWLFWVGVVRASGLLGRVCGVGLSCLLLARRLVVRGGASAVFRLGVGGGVAAALAALALPRVVGLAGAGRLVCRFRFGGRRAVARLARGSRVGDLRRVRAGVVLSARLLGGVGRPGGALRGGGA